MAQSVVARADDDAPGLYFEDDVWTWAEWCREVAARAALFTEIRTDGPPHIGVLLDNVPDYTFWLGAAAVTGAVIVGINPTRRGAELQRDITHTDCQLLVTSDAYGGLLDGLDLGIDGDHRFHVDRVGYGRSLAPHRHADLPDPAERRGREGYLLLFTSGTTGAPKACWCSQGRLAAISEVVAQRWELSPADVCYQAMPLFHSNALMTGWGPALAGAAPTALRRKFSASGFLPDVRRYGATYFNYVGKPLSYILATPEQPDDGDNPLTRVFGNEATAADIDRFAARFGCRVDDGYGSTEGGASVARVAGMPEGSLGAGSPGTVILDPATGQECPPARFDAAGHLLNPDEAIGEIVNRQAAQGFEGYYKNDEANQARVRDGLYWTGDLGYRDAEGWFYFAGRAHDWLRVDGENIAAAPVERIIQRHADVVLVAVYGVPDPVVGDLCMAAVQVHPGATFDGEAFGAWIDSQPDLGPVWAPRLVRVEEALPVTESNKVMKLQLQRQRWDAGAVWFRRAKSGSYRPLTAEDRAFLSPTDRRDPAGT